MLSESPFADNDDDDSGESSNPLLALLIVHSHNLARIKLLPKSHQRQNLINANTPSLGIPLSNPDIEYSALIKEVHELIKGTLEGLMGNLEDVVLGEIWCLGSVRGLGVGHFFLSPPPFFLNRLLCQEVGEC